jgi:hypothetical protein
MGVHESLPEVETLARHVHPPAQLLSPSVATDVSWQIPQSHISISHPATKQTPWWLWWNLLSLDAPTVALIWAMVFARANGVRLGAANSMVLLLAVYIIYSGDRLLDSWTMREATARQARHRFCEHHRFLLAVLLVPAIALALAFSSRLPLREIKAGLALAFIVAAYTFGIHAGRRLLTRVLPKELSVGVLFAAGTTVPLWSQTRALSGLTWLSVILFAMLCSLNCIAIDYWENPHKNSLPLIEHHLSRSPIQDPIARMAAALAVLSIGSALITRTKILPRAEGFSPVEFVALALGALLIFLLHHHRQNFSRPALRVLADAALVAAGLLALLVQI